MEPTRVVRTMTRRQLARHLRALALGALALVTISASILAACQQPVPAAPAKPGAGEPRRGGKMTVAIRADQPCFDGHDARCSQNASLILSVAHNFPLMPDFNDFSRILPEAVESYDVSPDGLVYTFKIRQGVRWHNVDPVNGRPFTADDLKWNIERFLTNKPTLNRFLFSNLEAVSKAEVVDPATLRVTLKQVDTLFISMMASTWFFLQPPEAVEKWGEAYAARAVGTGPFMFKENQKGVSTTFVRNPDYWEKGKPYLDEITFVVIPDIAAQKAAFRAGQVDYLNRVTPGDIDDLRSSIPNLVALKAFDGVEMLRINPKDPPLSDLRVRKAIHLAIDRQEMIKLVSLGTGTIGGIFEPPLEYSIPVSEIEKLPGFRSPKDQDLAEARRLMQEAGYGGGINLEGITIGTGVPFLAQTLELLATQLGKIGINLRVVPLDINIFRERVFAAANFQLAIEPVGLQDPNPLGRWVDLDSENPRNFRKVGTPEGDQLIRRARRTLDKAELARIYRRVQEIQLETYWNVPIFAAYTFNIHQPWIKNIPAAEASIVRYSGPDLRFAWSEKP